MDTEKVYVALDFETADTLPDSACALGLAKVRGQQVVDTLYSLIRPPRPQVMFGWVHGLTWNMVKNSPSFADFWPQVRDFLQDAHYLVAHNAGFDKRVLYACCEAAHIAPPPQPFLCTVKGSRRAGRLPSHKLNVVCQHYGIELDHHNAASDALASAKILIRVHEMGVEDEKFRS